MNRREWLKCFSALAMGAVAAPSLLATFDAHAAAQRPGYAPKFFNAPQDQLVTSVVDIIIPRSDTPGARSLDVALLTRIGTWLVGGVVTALLVAAFRGAA